MSRNVRTTNCCADKPSPARSGARRHALCILTLQPPTPKIHSPPLHPINKHNLYRAPHRESHPKLRSLACSCLPTAYPCTALDRSINPFTAFLRTFQKRPAQERDGFDTAATQGGHVEVRKNLHCCGGVLLRCPRLVCLPSFAFEFFGFVCMLFQWGAGRRIFLFASSCRCPIQEAALSKRAARLSIFIARRSKQLRRPSSVLPAMEKRRGFDADRRAANSVSQFFLAKIHGWDALPRRVDT